MATHLHLLLLLLLLLLLPTSSALLQSSQAWSLLRLRRLLNDPPSLAAWNSTADPCNSDPSPSLSVVCYGDSVTQLHISLPSPPPPLPPPFSLHSLFTTLSRLPDLRVLSLPSLGLSGALPPKLSRLSRLEILDLSSNHLFGDLPRDISFLPNLQSLILDRNNFSGPVPDWLTALPLLAVLSLGGNAFSGTLPPSLPSLAGLRVLRLAGNQLAGEVPDLSGLSNLQVLDLASNALGPGFPALPRKVVTVLLAGNRFAGGLPDEGLSSCFLLQRLDVSGNRFVGPLPPSVLSLPSVRFVNVSGNRFTGLLGRNASCGEALEAVDLSGNLLTGVLPDCLGRRAVGADMNCLGQQPRQRPPVFCETEALAVGVPPEGPRGEHRAVGHAVVSAVAGVFAAAAVVAGASVLVRRRRRNGASGREMVVKPLRRLVEHAPSTGYDPKMALEAKYIFQSGKLGAVDIPPYRTFSLEELEQATNNFDSSAFIGEGCDGEMYRGKLADGSLVAIRCLKLKKSHSSQSFARHIELISKLRHHHLVSALGHCFEYYLENSTVSRLFFVFEYIPNGTLRSHICAGVGGEKLSWIQRIGAAIGVAKGLQFLHGGMMPGLFGNKLNTTNIFLDQNNVAKISSYSLPALGDEARTEHAVAAGGSSTVSKDLSKRGNLDEKGDIYDFGVILVEIITGKPVKSKTEVDTAINKLRGCLGADGVARRRNLVDPVVGRVCSNESMRTVTDICLRCLSKEPMDRPSVEDVLWNLHFAIQVQDSWRGDSQSSEGSLSPSQYPPQTLVSIY